MLFFLSHSPLTVKSAPNAAERWEDMLESIGAVSATVLALVPGALYVWGFERVVGNWGVRLSDRLLRFVGVSVSSTRCLRP